MGVVAGLAHSRRMRVLVLALAFAAYALGGVAYAQKDKKVKGNFQTEKVGELQKTFKHGAVDRQYILHKPENLPANAPLLFVLHGRSGSNFWTYGLGFNHLADKNGFAVAYPQGEYRYMKGEEPNDPKAKGWTEWNAHMDPARVDDVDFLSSLARALQSEHDLNPDQTFVTGFSMGGYMSYALACQASETFKGVAIVASLMDHKLYVDNNPPPNPLPVLHIHGTADSLCLIDGNINKETGEKIPPTVAEIIDLWAKRNRCITSETKKITDTTTAHFHRGGIDGNEVHYYEIANGKHVWPGQLGEKAGYSDISGINATELIWDFFSKY